MSELRCNHSAKPGDSPHGKYLENVPESFVYIFDGQDLILAWPMCAEHKPVWWESDAYRTRRPPVPLDKVPLPRPRRRKITVDGRIRSTLKKLVADGKLNEVNVPGLRDRGPLPEPTRDYYYQLERQGLIPDEYLFDA